MAAITLVSQRTRQIEFHVIERALPLVGQHFIDLMEGTLSNLLDYPPMLSHTMRSGDRL